MLSQTPEENADVFREFFEAQYKRKPTGRLSAADLLPQLPVFADAGRVPSHGEVRRAVKKRNLSGPGHTGNNAAAWKALLVNESVFAWIYEYTLPLLHARPASRRLGTPATEDTREEGRPVPPQELPRYHDA
jgi:hypothetical protein